MPDFRAEDPTLADAAPDADDDQSDLELEGPPTEEVEGRMLMGRRRVALYLLIVLVIVFALYFVLP